MKHSFAIPAPRRYSLASGSVVEACVAFERCSPLKFESGLRPPVGGGSSASPRGLKLFIEAQASTSVPSTEKCSLERSLFTRGCARRAAKNAAATSPARSRSRFFENVDDPRPDRRPQRRRTSGTKGRTPAAPSAGAPIGSNRKLARASLEGASQVQWMADRCSRKALQNLALASPVPRWRSIGLPATGGPVELEPPNRHTKKVRRFGSRCPALSKPSESTTQVNHGRGDSASCFFNTLLGRRVARAPEASCAVGRTAPGFASG